MASGRARDVDRRGFFGESARLALALAAAPGALRAVSAPRDSMTLFLCGDVMTGRGIDQILPTPGDPRLHERWVEDAREYVRLAEQENGPIPAPVDPAYVWGHALDVLRRVSPDARIINLETSVTTSDDPWPDKGIHYRMHPSNVTCLTAAAVDCCVLANNHVIDWGHAGLRETLDVLQAAGIHAAGAGNDLSGATAPAILDAGNAGRVLVFALGAGSSGIPDAWAATGERPGVWFAGELTRALAERLASDVEQARRPGDVVIASIHWGGNWGYEIPDAHREFAHALVDEARVDAIHGHSSHHPLGIEIYRGRPILYGCGDFINDYEGIGGREEFRGNLSLMYFPRFELATGRLAQLRLVPCRMERFRLHPASKAETEWLRRTLDRESALLGSRVVVAGDGALEVVPEGAGPNASGMES